MGRKGDPRYRWGITSRLSLRPFLSTHARTPPPSHRKSHESLTHPFLPLGGEGGLQVRCACACVKKNPEQNRIACTYLSEYIQGVLCRQPHRSYVSATDHQGLPCRLLSCVRKRSGKQVKRAHPVDHRGLTQSWLVSPPPKKDTTCIKKEPLPLKLKGEGRKEGGCLSSRSYIHTHLLAVALLLSWDRWWVN
ncbi:hypothetical protein BDZ97DRAFT_134717 [Flammula alnicola]|nr:hypothetical protein BDZ97DRAFT_134717 [Flammula alnicola]